MQTNLLGPYATRMVKNYGKQPAQTDWILDRMGYTVQELATPIKTEIDTKSVKSGVKRSEIDTLG